MEMTAKKLKTSKLWFHELPNEPMQWLNIPIESCADECTEECQFLERRIPIGANAWAKMDHIRDSEWYCESNMEHQLLFYVVIARLFIGICLWIKPERIIPLLWVHKIWETLKSRRNILTSSFSFDLPDKYRKKMLYHVLLHMGFNGCIK